MGIIARLMLCGAMVSTALLAAEIGPGDKVVLVPVPPVRFRRRPVLREVVRSRRQVQLADRGGGAGIEADGLGVCGRVYGGGRGGRGCMRGWRRAKAFLPVRSLESAAQRGAFASGVRPRREPGAHPRERHAMECQCLRGARWERRDRRESRAKGRLAWWTSRAGLFCFADGRQ